MLQHVTTIQLIFPRLGPSTATLGVGLFLESCGARDGETGTGGGTDTWAAAGGEQRVILLKPRGMMSTNGRVSRTWRPWWSEELLETGGWLLGIWISWTYLKWDRARAPERHALTGVPLIWSGVLRRSCRWRQHHLNIEKIHGLGKEGMNGLQMRGRWHRSNYSSSSPPAFGWCSSQDFSTITIHSLGQPTWPMRQEKIRFPAWFVCVSASNFWQKRLCCHAFPVIVVALVNQCRYGNSMKLHYLYADHFSGKSWISTAMLVYGLLNGNFCCIQIFLRMATVVFFSRKPFIVSLQRMSPVVSQYLAHVACLPSAIKSIFSHSSY